jgi:geranylgeranyl diphosphate synthase, type II
VIADRIRQHAAVVNAGLDRMLAERRNSVPAKLWSAMHYSLMAGGKRIRPALMLECLAACGGRQEILQAAMSIECMHTYSLIHDDLPAMDNDDLRRGMPTCHRRFDEATAILAADALQALSFELLALQSTASSVRVELIRRLANAAGAAGMVGGQMLDIQSEAGRVADVQEVERIHNLKTGALLRYSCEAGALLAGADAHDIETCSRYGTAVGLLFQIADDILDATASSEALGKSAGKDAAQSKATYVSLLGLEGARAYAQSTHRIALEAAGLLGENGKPLQEFATYIMEREQ